MRTSVATVTTGQPYSGSALPTPHGEGARKGTSNIAHYTHSYLVNRENVRTLLDRNENTERPERRTAIVARELGHLGIDTHTHTHTHTHTTILQLSGLGLGQPG